MINYLFVNYLERLLIVNPEYLFFWKPHGYLNYPKRLFGPSIIFTLVYFLFMLFLLYLSNSKKIIKDNIVLRSLIFVTIYLWICFPERAHFPGIMRSYIEQSTWSPIENYMKKTKRDFIKESVSTPFGTYKMFGDIKSDRLNVLQRKCHVEPVENKECYDYPFEK